MNQRQSQIERPLTILQIFFLSLTPHIELLAVSVRIAANVIKVKRKTFLRRDDLLYRGYGAPGCRVHARPNTKLR